MKFYKDHYDVIVIGGALSGLSSALMLAEKGKDVLVLERHNLPGGIATSFVRGGIEIEAALHEMMSIGPEGNRLKVGKFLEDMGVFVDWLKVPEAYHASLPGIEVTMHPGLETFAKEVDREVPGTYEKVLKVLNLCHTVFDSVNELSIHPMSKVQMLLKHEAFVKTAGYSTQEVLDTFDLPKKAQDLLAPYWIYVGTGFSELPFTIFSVLMADYIGYGSYIPRKFSHEMSVKMAERAEGLGVQIEYRQHVEKILVKNGKVYGVRTARGDEIHCDYVISGPYPNRVYSQMIEPLSEVPVGAIKMINNRKLSVVPVSVILLIEGTPEENGITDYSTFSGTTMDTNEIWENYANITEPYNYITTICLNHANPHCVPEGYTQLSITALPLNQPFADVKEEDYHALKRRLANEMIETYLRHTGIPDFRDKIVEIEVETPMTVAHYVGAWKGSIYGYSHSLSDHAVARLQMKEKDHFIEGLEFAGAHGMSGDGMGPQITNGRAAAKAVHEDMEKKKEAAKK